jgi:hypothetical protein
MKMLVLLLISISGFTSNLMAQNHSGHASHNMLLFGNDEVFADHIVYKEPHNFQVVVKVEFEQIAKDAYLAARADFPGEEIVFLLDPMDIETIELATSLSGKILRRSDSSQTVVLSGITLDQSQFKVLFFNKLPLSLAGNVHRHGVSQPFCPRWPIVHKCQ